MYHVIPVVWYYCWKRYNNYNHHLLGSCSHKVGLDIVTYNNNNNSNNNNNNLVFSPPDLYY